MAAKKDLKSIEDLVRNIDFPHHRIGLKRKWRKTGAAPKRDPRFAFDRLCFYAERLRELGMSDTDITCMFSDLYWDAVDEQGLAKEEAIAKN